MILNSDLRKKVAAFALTGFAAMTLVGCGGSSSSTTTAPGSSAGVVKIFGKAVKGPFKRNSTVTISRLNANGTKGAQLGAGSVSADDGSYEIGFSNYTGPVLVEVDGTYVDEATGTEKTVVSTAPVQSIAVAPTVAVNTTQNVTAHVTPLTHMVVANVVESAKNVPISTEDTDLAKSFVDLRAQSIADAFGLGSNFDVLSTEPSLQSTDDSTISTAYGIILAGISQLLEDEFNNDYASFATSSTKGILAVTDTSSTSLKDAVTSALVSLASNTNFTTVYSTISTNALTSATSNIDTAKIVTPHQHEFATALAVASTPMTTAQTASVTATMQTTGTTADAELVYAWSVGMKSSCPVVSYVYIPVDETTINNANNYGLVTVSAESISKTSAVSFWAAYAGEYSVKVEVSRANYKTVTATANILVTDPNLSNLIGNTFYVMDIDNHVAASGGKAVFGTDRVLTVTEDPTAAYNRTHAYVSQDSLVAETGQWHYSGGYFYLWDVVDGVKDSSALSRNVTDELNQTYVAIGSYTRLYATAAERNNAVTRYNALNAPVTVADFNNKAYWAISEQATPALSGTFTFGAGPGSLAVAGDLTGFESTYSYNATTATSNWYYTESTLEMPGHPVMTQRKLMLGEREYGVYKYTVNIATSPYSFSHLLISYYNTETQAVDAYNLCLNSDTTCRTHFTPAEQ